jgi:hypothetical protein
MIMLLGQPRRFAGRAQGEDALHGAGRSRVRREAVQPARWRPTVNPRYGQFGRQEAVHRSIIDRYGDASIPFRPSGAGIGGWLVASNEIDGGLAQARQELRELMASMADAEREPPEGHGEAADGMVRATATDGRISSVELHPRAMKLASQELGEAFAEAANAALTDLASKYHMPSLPTVDLAKLDAQLAEAEQETTLKMREFEQAINDAYRHIGR